MHNTWGNTLAEEQIISIILCSSQNKCPSSSPRLGYVRSIFLNIEHFSASFSYNKVLMKKRRKRFNSVKCSWNMTIEFQWYSKYACYRDQLSTLEKCTSYPKNFPSYSLAHAFGVTKQVHKGLCFSSNTKTIFWTKLFLRMFDPVEMFVKETKAPFKLVGFMSPQFTSIVRRWIDEYYEKIIGNFWELLPVLKWLAWLRIFSWYQVIISTQCRSKERRPNSNCCFDSCCFY